MRPVIHPFPLLMFKTTAKKKWLEEKGAKGKDKSGLND